ncbi:ketose-bisphosphate aldolase [Lactococcus termiticola]|uniref:Fructose-bisphosphate aldolase n=1 Tax=Lactococcus termiticola TaxID=2169526 RepID=A0A2R5HHU3_9LACT|nr:ketose-bisphosphate aldolase [Lactococcus termiticola]GBG96945.1 fructose-bisphosphate aldolase [Lactococcus termiticola]
MHPIKHEIQKAERAGYAIGAFNSINLEWMQAILRAGEATGQPVILQTSVPPVAYMGGLGLVKSLYDHLLEALEISVPVALHLDHGDAETVRQAIAVGYDSVMFDGSHLPMAENLRLSAELIELAQAHDVLIECEVGSIGGSEDNIYGKGEIASLADAKAMADLGPDYLAVGIGNIHGRYPEDWPGLDFDQLKILKQGLGDLPLVLHGASGIPDDQIKQAIKQGISKVNVNTECHLAFSTAMIDYVHEFESHKEDYLNKKYYEGRHFLSAGYQAVEDKVKERIELFSRI